MRALSRNMSPPPPTTCASRPAMSGNTSKPGVEIDVRTSTRSERLDTGAFDFAVRLARDAEMPVAPLLPIHLMPVWSTARPIVIESATDILRHPLLGPDHRPEFWREWLESAELSHAADRCRAVDSLLLYDYAVGGAGVAIGIEPLVSGLVADGRLRGLQALRIRSVRSFFLLTGDRPRTRANRLFKQWLHGQAARP